MIDAMSRSPCTMDSRITPLLLMAVAFAAPAAAQFEGSEVSGAGAPPFAVVKSGAVFEDLAIPARTYNIYRRVPGDGFRCLASNLTSASWAGDAASPPAGEAWWYSVVADDGWGENRHGNGIAIVERCPCSGPPPVPGIPTLTAQRISGGLVDAVHVTSAPGDRARLYVVEKAGRVVLFRRGVRQATPFLDLTSHVVTNVEQGLLSIAFHPQFAANGRFFVYYNSPGGGAEGHIVVAEIVTADADSAGVDPPERVLFTLDKRNAYHNGGQLAFGPLDGYLYIGIGDDGVQDEAQRTDSYFGKLLRIDVDGGTPYGVPPDNPFLATPGALPELWAIGLRNPWRFGFDPVTDDLYIGDVGTDCREEIDVATAPRLGGENYGWRFLEGTRCPVLGCTATSTCGPGCFTAPSCAPFTMPVVEYDHGASGGCSVTGGLVYRGCRMPDLRGTYLYADWCSNWLRSFVLTLGLPTDMRDWGSLGGAVRLTTSFGADANRELYFVNSGTGGALWRLAPP